MLKRRMPSVKIGHLTRVGALAVAMLTVGLALGAGLMSTDAQVGGGEIRACASIFTGGLRITSSGQCTPNERPLNWNQQGPEGQQGPRGQEGPEGPSGLLDVQRISEAAIVRTEDNKTFAGRFVACPDGYIVIGGGAGLSSVSGFDNFFLSESRPHTSFGVDGWNSTFETTDGEPAVGEYHFVTEAICALVDEPQAVGGSPLT